jgi:hypothetical protein
MSEHTNDKVQMVCSRCGSTDVLSDAYARWNTKAQRWKLESTFDKGAYCANCDGECRIEEVPLAAEVCHG